ncbi:MAG: ATP-dependent DNA helicase RecG [Legionellaceae bacterium]|nr:ATP-dependent DNA helicase RecG [Legionellaceae bacterium]
MLTDSCETLSGVGPALAEKLAKCGIHSIADLLFHLPYRYQDRTHVTPMADLREQEWAVVVGNVVKTEVKIGKRRMLYCYLADQSGGLRLRFFHFNQRQIELMQACDRLCAFGEVRAFSGQWEMIHPEYQLLAEDAPLQVSEHLTPIYALTQGLTQSRLRPLIKRALQLGSASLAALEWMTEAQRQELGFPSLAEAIPFLHYPPPEVSVESLASGAHPALQRLVFDEFLAQRVSMQFARRMLHNLRAAPLPLQPEVKEALLHQLPFCLTAAQQRVLAEIEGDLQGRRPMLRLVQGDVGSGKTVVACLAALQAIANGYQVAFMAPTDILSEQHAQTMVHWLQPLGIQCQRLSGKMKVAEKRAALSALADGSCPLVIGTHALFQQKVVFARLGLVIIDEQHRFGVEQRLSLQQKGADDGQLPHQLLMTATPIPRTLAMTRFAHLDLSVIDELPPGRTPVTTAVIPQQKRDLIIERLRDAMHSGRQVYWVCTLIEESEKLQCIAASETAQYLQATLAGVRVGLVHGRMKGSEKDATMLAFKRGELDLLVATTVIEVGVDVPNASLMVIENAERLGLSQLHQLRGRVGRGSSASHCLLLYQAPLSEVGQERLRVMRATTDGFVIAETDLKLRGAGDRLGSRQTGYQQFKFADLARDAHLLPQVALMAQKLLETNPALAKTIARRWLGDYEAFVHA